jgi:lactoylglutathione lyase
MILATRHTGLVVGNLEKSIRFYEALGLKVWRREKESGPFIDTVVGLTDVCLEWAKLRCPDGTTVELLQYYSHSDTRAGLPAVTPSNRLGCSHIAFTVTDIDQACAEIRRLGGIVVNEPAVAPSGQVKVAYCQDVDAIIVELVEEIHH